MRSILQRMLITFMGIFLLTFVVMILVISRYLAGYYFDLKQKELLEQGQDIRSRIAEYKKGDLSQDRLDLYVNAVSDAAGIRILAVDFGSDQDSLSAISGQFGKEGFYDLESIKQGRTITRKRQFGTDDQIEVVLVGLPIYSAQEDVQGALLLVSPLSGMQETVANVTRIIWGIAAAFMLVAGLLIYWNARRISAPIAAVSQAAVNIAEGREEPDIAVSGRDEISRLADSFNYMKNRLRQIEEMRQDLISNVSHELRTPLTTMGGFVQAIIDGKIKPEDQTRYLQLVRMETKRLARLVNDILLTAQVQSGNVELVKQSLYIPEVTDEVVESLGLEAAERSIDIIHDKEITVPKIQADRDRIKQIILNILGNALQHTPAKGIISISYFVDDQSVLVKICDSGPGIPEDKIGMVFEKFYRADSSRQNSGTGLGLSIVRQLAELHGGRVAAANNLGSGITVTVSLPR